LPNAAANAWDEDRSVVRVPDPAIEVIDERFASLLVGQAVVERLWTGARWLEGPVWFGDGRVVLFSDIPNTRSPAGCTSSASPRTTPTATPATCRVGWSRAST
jgi:gluconolactonase